jgi:hypothetical protein
VSRGAKFFNLAHAGLDWPVNAGPFFTEYPPLVTSRWPPNLLSTQPSIRRLQKFFSTGFGPYHISIKPTMGALSQAAGLSALNFQFPISEIKRSRKQGTPPAALIMPLASGNKGETIKSVSQTMQSVSRGKREPAFCRNPYATLDFVSFCIVCPSKTSIELFRRNGMDRNRASRFPKWIESVWKGRFNNPHYCSNKTINA